MTIVFRLIVVTSLLLAFRPAMGQADGKPVGTGAPVALQTSFSPEINGIRQVIEVKTDDVLKPVLLFLSGGPGSSMINNADKYTDILKTRFTIVQWDQRDAGKTLKLNPSPVKPTVALMTKDTYLVIEFISQQLKQEKIYLLGSSWGNVLGFDIVRNHPELLHAYFAVNPVISQFESEQELLGVLKQHFQADPFATAELNAVHIPFEVDEDLFYLRKWLFYRDGKQNVVSPEFRTGFLQWSAAWSPVWREVMAIDLPKSLTSVDCPVYFFVGKNDIQTSTRITKAYFDVLKAPRKELVMFHASGHQIHQDEPVKFQEAIVRTLDTPADASVTARK